MTNTKNLLAKCCRCERIRVNGEWFDRDSYSTYDEMIRTHNITDGYCPECVEFYKEEKKKLKQIYGAIRN